jgi:hypothetical protein
LDHYRRANVGDSECSDQVVDFLAFQKGLSKMIDFPIVIAPTEFSIAEYDFVLDRISLWDWLAEARWYRFGNENAFEMVVRIICHEELHRIIYKLQGKSATRDYDRITTCDIRDLV